MKIIKLKKIKPMFTSLITTMDTYDDHQVTEGGLIDGTKMAGTVKEYQTVVAKGDSVREIKVGDVVSVNPTRFGVKKHKAGSLKDGVIEDNPVEKFEFDIIEIDGKDHLMLQDRDINFIIEEYEEVEIKPKKKSGLILPDNKIIN